MSQLLIPLVTALAMFMNEPLASQPKTPSYLQTRLLSMKGAIVAYRGGSLEAPENSLQAIKQSLLLGVDGVHVDVRVTKNGELVLAAEENLERVTGQTVLVSETNYEDLPSLQKTIVSEYGETYEYLQEEQTQEAKKIPIFDEVVELFLDYDAFLVIQDHTLKLEQSKKIINILYQKGLLNKTVIQTEKNRWEKLRSLYTIPLTLMEPTNKLEQKFEEFVHGQFQTQTEPLETNVFNTTFDFKTIRESPLEVRQETLSVTTRAVSGFSWPSQNVTFEEFTQIMKDYKPYVQLMNLTYQQKAKIPVSYFPVNYAEDFELVKELGANFVFTEKPAELIVEQQTQQWTVQREQLSFRR